MTEIDYKNENSFEKRLDESTKIMKKFPDRVPIIVESRSKKIVLDKKKFLVPRDLILGQFLFVIRKRIQNIKSTDGIFLIINKNSPKTSSTINELYEEHKDPDGFLYVDVTIESTFG